MTLDGYARFVLSAMLDAVVVLDVADTILYVNDAATRMLGYERDALIGERLARLFADPESALHSTTRLQVAHHGHEFRREEVDLVSATGDVIPVSLTGSPMVDADGDLVGIVFVARDLRDARRLLAELARAKASVEAELDRTRAQLVHAERLATLGTLAGGFGHELANVSQVFVSAGERLRELVDRGQFSEPLMRAHQRACAHVVGHANRLLDLARPGPDYDEPMDLRDVVRDTLELLDGAGKTKFVAVSASLPDAPIPVSVNRTRIEQILVNLIANAVDAVAVRPMGDRRVAVALSRGADRRAVCRIEDNGCGISANALGEVFEPFYTTKPPGQGTGLGLPVVKQIVEGYGGSIQIDSTPDAGTVVTFALPCG